MIQVQFFRDKNIKITVRGEKKHSQVLGVTGLQGCPSPSSRSQVSCSIHLSQLKPALEEALQGWQSKNPIVEPVSPRQSDTGLGGCGLDQPGPLGHLCLLYFDAGNRSGSKPEALGCTVL